MDNATFADRLNTLIEASRQRHEPIPSASDIARAISIKAGQVVGEEVVADALAGRSQLPPALLDAVISHYKASDELFTDGETGREAHKRLKVFLEITARYMDGGPNIIARGSRLTETQLDEILDFLSSPQRG